MAEWTPDPRRHRPEGMDMAGRVLGDPPGLLEESAVVRDARLRSELIRALNGRRLDRDACWDILNRWDELTTREALRA